MSKFLSLIQRLSFSVFTSVIVHALVMITLGALQINRYEDQMAYIIPSVGITFLVSFLFYSKIFTESPPKKN